MILRNSRFWTLLVLVDVVVMEGAPVPVVPPRTLPFLRPAVRSLSFSFFRAAGFAAFLPPLVLAARFFFMSAPFVWIRCVGWCRP